MTSSTSVNWGSNGSGGTATATNIYELRDIINNSLAARVDGLKMTLIGQILMVDTIYMRYQTRMTVYIINHIASMVFGVIQIIGHLKLKLATQIIWARV